MRRAMLLFLILIACMLAITSCAHEVDQAQAVQMTKEAIREKLHENDETLNSYVYEAVRATEGNVDVWYVDVQADMGTNDLYGLYHVTIGVNNGEIITADIEPDAIQKVEKRVNMTKALETLIAQRGPMYSWTMEEFVSFEQTYGDSCYRLPTGDDLSKEQAIAIAREALKEKGIDVSSDVPELVSNALLYDVETSGRNQWYVYFYTPDMLDSFGNPSPHLVYVSNPDGAVIDICEYTGGGNG